MKQISFGEIAEFRNGLNFGKDSHGMGCLLIGIPDFKDRFNPDYNSLGEINPLGIIKEEDYLQKEDILFVRSNGNKNLVGRSLYIDKDIKAVYSGFCIRARLTSSTIDSLFCAYYTRSDRFKSSISSSGGTNIQNLNQGILSNVKLPLFSISSQRQIAKVLSDLDAKIEVNNKINQELEAMAKTLYDYWFVQFDFPDANGKPYKSSGGKMVFNEALKREIPEGWEVEEINKVIEVKDGTHDSPKSIDKGFKLITSKHLKLEGLDFDSANSINEEDYKNINKRSQVDTGDILFSMIGNIGTVYKVEEKTIDFAIKNVALYKTSEHQNFKNYIYTYLRSYDMQRYMGNVISGSIQKFIGLGSLRKMPLMLDEKTISSFEIKTRPIFTQINNLKLENQKLSELRDWLLPMLMNGQITITNKELGMEREVSLRGTKQSHEGNAMSELGRVAECMEDYKTKKNV